MTSSDRPSLRETVVVIQPVTIPYSSGDFFGQTYTWYKEPMGWVTIPYSSSDFFGQMAMARNTLDKAL